MIILRKDIMNHLKNERKIKCIREDGIMVQEVSRNVIHKWAAAGATTAGALPVGADAAALFGEEVLMVIHVASLFGQSISKKTASQAIATGTLGVVAGTAIFESLNVAYPFTIPAKIAVAVGVIEALGNATYEFYKNGGTL